MRHREDGAGVLGAIGGDDAVVDEVLALLTRETEVQAIDSLEFVRRADQLIAPEHDCGPPLIPEVAGRS